MNSAVPWKTIIKIYKGAYQQTISVERSFEI